jgi:hypothetical protein
VLPDSEELVAEYAVDLNLQLTAVTSTTGTTDPNLGLLSPGDPSFTTFTGPVFNSLNTPQLIRSVRVRLGVRSREADRVTGLPNGAGQGLFRFNVGSDTATPPAPDGSRLPELFARVRTFQADVMLHNQMDVLWK